MTQHPDPHSTYSEPQHSRPAGSRPAYSPPPRSRSGGPPVPEQPSSVPRVPSRPLGLPVLGILGLALLAVPRVVLHDLGILQEGTAVNALFVFLPPLIWIGTVVLLRVRRPFLALLAVGIVYGVFLAGVHQLFWGQALSEGTQLGGNLAGADPVVQGLIVRGFAAISSLVTGTLVGAVCGLVATGISALVSRARGGRS